MATMPAGERLRVFDRAGPAIRGAMALTVAERSEHRASGKPGRSGPGQRRSSQCGRPVDRRHDRQEAVIEAIKARQQADVRELSERVAALEEQRGVWPTHNLDDN